MEEKRVVVVAFEFLADAQRGVRFVHASREGNGHCESQFGDRTRIDRRSGEHRNSAPMAFGIVDVRQKIAFDVEHRPQIRRPVESRFVQWRLADQRDSLRQIPVDVLLRGGRSVMPDHAAQSFEAALGGFVKDAIDPSRMRIEQDDGFVGWRGGHEAFARLRMSRSRVNLREDMPFLPRMSRTVGSDVFKFSDA